MIFTACQFLLPKRANFKAPLFLIALTFIVSFFTSPYQYAYADDADGIWKGELKTEKGICPTQMPSTLMIRNDEILFVPGSGSITLKGTIDPEKPHYHAQYIAKDVNRKPFPMVFEGQPDTEEESFKGVYATPSCRASIVLHK